MIVAVTGAAGFLGWHLRCRMLASDLACIPMDRHTCSNSAVLDDVVRRVDVVVHLAGVNRAASDAEVVTGNLEAAQALINARSRTGARFDVIYANSVKADSPGPYGESKLRAAELLAADARAAGCRFVDIRFPHLFGEFGRPYYNSAVSTFAHQLATGQLSQVTDGELELLHVQDAAHIIIEALNGDANSTLRPRGQATTVPEAYEVLRRLSDYVSTGTIPYLADRFELRLFNTLRSQMWPDAYPMPLVRHADHRGAFFEVVRAWGKGQTSISTTKPGISRGDHFHFDKVERFAVVGGQASIRVRRILTLQQWEFNVSAQEPVVIDMPTLCTHKITNTSESELTTLFWSHDHFSQDTPDTYHDPVHPSP